MPQQTHDSILLLRDVVIADDTAIDLATAAGQLKVDNAVHVDPGREDFEVFFYGTTGGGTDADTNVSLYGWTDQESPTFMLGTWSLTLGTQNASVIPWGDDVTSGLYVDTITEDADYWGVNIRNSAVNHICRLGFYFRGLRWLYAEFTNVAVGANEIETIYAAYRAY